MTRNPSILTIRRATLDDAEALAAFAERTFRDTFAGDNDPGDLDAYCASAFSVAAQRANLQDPAIETLLARTATAR
jgi:diamine N-acetyltransferase